MPKKGAKTIGIRMYAVMAYSGHCDLESHEHGQGYTRVTSMVRATRQASHEHGQGYTTSFMIYE